MLLESMASGTLFVATRVGGVPEIADPVLDRLVPPADARALAAAILYVVARAAPGRGPRLANPNGYRCDGHRLVAVLESTIDARRRSATSAEAPIGDPATDTVGAPL